MWMNIPAFYQGDLYRALVATDRVDLHVVYTRHLSDDRRQLGWKEDVSGYRSTFLSSRYDLAEAARLAWRERDRIHVVNGLWHEPAFGTVEMALQFAGGCYAVYSEMPDMTVSRPLFSRLARRAVQKGLIRGASGVFPVARLGEGWIRGLGVPEERIYPFGYFRAHSVPERLKRRRRAEKRQELIFVGRIDYVKGIDLLATAMLRLLPDYPALSLSIVGTGPMQTSMTRDMRSLFECGKLQFEGAIPVNEITARMARADALVLPSRWDGWGLVVNEAFSVGVPVIVSDRCGAADIVKLAVNGYVFQSENVDDLSAKLRAFLDRPETWPSMRAAALDASRTVSVEAVAPYLIECIAHMAGYVQEKPVPPWRAGTKSFDEGERGNGNES